MIYLDHNASTPLDPRVLEAMLPYFGERHANASSTEHAAGSIARQAVEKAREQVADLLAAAPEDIIFTSGATEANNIAVLGTLGRADPSAEILANVTEHPAVLEAARVAGDRLRLIPVNSSGIVDAGEIRSRLSSRTALVAVMAANNETGVIQPIKEIAAMCADVGVPLHVDAAQAAGRIELDVGTDSPTTLAISAHKMYGPQGVGALYVRRRRPRAKLSPILYGGGHERNLRPGTLNVPGIVGLGEAAHLAMKERVADKERHASLRDHLLGRLKQSSVDVVETVPNAPRLPQTLSVRFEGVRSAAVIRAVSNQLAISTGSACSTTSLEPSHVLLAQGLARDQIAEVLRISFGRQTTEEEVDRAADLLLAAVESAVLVGRAAQPA